jgi:phosphoribosylamine--glycine ligase
VLDAGARCSVEEYLDGPEVSLFAVTDGTTVLPLLPAQDAKRRDDGDAGPTPAGWAPTRRCRGRRPGLVDEVLATVLQPTSTSCAAAASRSPGCSTPGWR